MPLRPLARASCTVANSSRARSSSRSEPNETDNETSSQLTDRFVERSALPAADRRRALRESRSRVRPSSDPIAVTIAVSVLCAGCSSMNAGSHSCSRARSANVSSNTVLPTPRRPVTLMLACCSGAARSIASKRRNGASRPARYSGRTPTPGL